MKYALNVREGPPAAAMPAITWPWPKLELASTMWELSDPVGKSVGEWFTLGQALGSLRHDWPPRTVLRLVQWRLDARGIRPARQWYAQYDFCGTLRTTRIRRRKGKR